MRSTTRIFRSCLAVAMGILFWGCAGSGNDQAPKVSQTGQHPADWVTTHPLDYASHPDQCATCHGSITDTASTGGISKVSCFSCHTGPVVHPDNWAEASQHGRLGAQGEAVASTAAANGTGMAACATCHGGDLAGGIVKVSCTSCHTQAPHPDRPWISASLALSSHTFTSFTNALECYKCHANGANFAGTPPPAPAPGTAPGCFNNTMCHGNFG